MTKQEIGFHETETSSKLNAQLITQCFAIQEALGTKYAFFITNWAQFIIGIGIAFFYSWHLTLALFATLPALVLVGCIQGKLLAGMDNKDSDPYVNAGSFSQQVLTNIKTVIAFPSLYLRKLHQYSNLVDQATPIATKKMVYIGFGLGAFMLSKHNII